MNPLVRIHYILHGSIANGPGLRNVVWFQGCKMNCPGCFNPETHDPEGGKRMSVSDLSAELLSGVRNVSGITISGGEPFLQKEGLLALLRTLKEQSSLPVLIFSGYEQETLRADPVCAECLRLADALICGPFHSDEKAAPERFCSSENQRLILLSDRYRTEDFQDLPRQEMMILPDGEILQSGLTKFIIS